MERQVTLYPHERLDDLHRRGYQLIQNPEAFCFGVDAVLLSHFAAPRAGQKILDLCSGNGVIPILLASRRDGLTLSGLEIQAEGVDMARRSAAFNGLDIAFTQGDVKEVRRYFPAGSFDTVTANPPYMNAGGGLISEGDAKAIARHELLCSLEDVIAAASDMLRFGGRFYMVHRPTRLADILCGLRAHKLEPKTLRFVHSYAHKAPSMVLVEAVRGGKAFLTVQPPLIIYEQGGSYTKEVIDIYYH